jgi:hypothetical protein
VEESQKGPWEEVADSGNLSKKIEGLIPGKCPLRGPDKGIMYLISQDVLWHQVTAMVNQPFISHSRGAVSCSFQWDLRKVCILLMPSILFNDTSENHFSYAIDFTWSCLSVPCDNPLKNGLGIFFSLVFSRSTS